MEYKEHKLFVVAETQLSPDYWKLLKEIGAPGWETDAHSDMEELAEVCGRLCYKAFGTGLNPNVTKVREGNELYLGNVMKQKHGSVFEHGYTTVVMLDVSRILTHEQVRHRVGVGYSQESLRFVRTDNFSLYKPDALGMEFIQRYVAEFVEDKNGAWADRVATQIKGKLDHHMRQLESLFAECIAELNLDHPAMPFHVKKKITSALRRWAPSGQLTNIAVTANHRAWRHMLEQRTSDGAEEEIRKVFYDIGKIFQKRYPAIYQDMYEVTHEDRSKGWAFVNGKI